MCDVRASLCSVLIVKLEHPSGMLGALYRPRNRDGGRKSRLCILLKIVLLPIPGSSCYCSVEAWEELRRRVSDASSRCLGEKNISFSNFKAMSALLFESHCGVTFSCAIRACTKQNPAAYSEHDCGRRLCDRKRRDCNRASASLVLFLDPKPLRQPTSWP
jgi:hypothetical protein